MTVATISADRKQTRVPALTAAEVAQRLHAISQDGELDGDSAVAEVVTLAANLTGALGTIFLARDEAQRLTVQRQFYAPPHISHLRSLMQHALRLGTVACAEEAPQIGNAENNEDVIVVAVPVFGGVNGNEALVAAISAESAAQARSTAAYLIQLLTWIAAYIGPLRNRGSQQQNVQNVNLSRVAAMLGDAATKPRLQDSGKTIAEWLRNETRSSAVVIGMKRRCHGACQLIAHSGGIELDVRSEAAVQFREAVEEAIIADEITRAHDNEVDRKRNSEPDAENDGAPNDEQDGETHSKRDNEAGNSNAKANAANANSANANSAATSSFDHEELLNDTSVTEKLRQSTDMQLTRRYVLRTAGGQPFGAILCLDEVESPHRIQDLPSESINWLGQHLALLSQAEPTFVARMLSLQFEGKRWYRHPYTWTTLAALMLLMLIPMPLKVKSPCVVQAQQRRFVAVPYEGRLEQAFAEPGEIVTAGQLLARMDGREVRFEISGLQAQLRSAEKDRDIAVAAFETSASQLAGLEIERLQLQIDVLNQRLENLEIRSPVDGIVMGGDPRKLEGARLSMGETLLEVGPMDKLVVEVEIADEDISHIRAEQQVRYRLDAMPWQAIQGQISLVHPRSENRNNQNVFVAEVALDNQDLAIRPGMRGRVKIRTGYHPLGWNLFHKAWNGLVTFIGW